MRDKVLFTYNPNAGTRRLAPRLNDVVCELLDENSDLVLVPTRKRNDAKEAVKACVGAGGYVKVVCSGGDGTLHEVVGGMMECEPEKRVPIGYLPAGSTNDFGYSMGLPTDVVEAAKVARGGVEYPCDIGLFNGVHVAYAAAFGLFSDISYATSQTLKNIFGHAAYVLSGAAALANIQFVAATVTLPGETISGKFLLGTLVNASSIGGFRGITGREVRLDDGKYELFLIREPAPFQVPGLLNDIRRENFNNPLIVYRQTEEAVFEFAEEVPWTIDGEYGGAFRSARMSVLKHAVTFMAPQEFVGKTGT